MKKIIATDVEYGTLGNKKSVTLHYQDGSTKKITLPIDYSNKDQVRSYTGYVINNFNLRNKK